MAVGKDVFPNAHLLLQGEGRVLVPFTPKDLIMSESFCLPAM